MLQETGTEAIEKRRCTEYNVAVVRGDGRDVGS
jgi:hypothetical protein